MLISKLKEKYGYDIPIFIKEITDSFPNYSEQEVCRQIKDAVEKGILVCFMDGVYFFSEMTPFGNSVITPSAVMKKKYITDGSDVYGIYSGLLLLNQFSLTSQIPNTVELVTNRTSQQEEIVIDGMKFVVHKSYYTITEENAEVYRILQFLYEKGEDSITGNERKAIRRYMTKNDIKEAELLCAVEKFPFHAGERLKEVFHADKKN